MFRANWRESVEEVERGLAKCLAALDRYEQSFKDILTTTPADAPPAVAESRPSGWSECLATAGERAASVERLLAEQEDAWRRWHDAVGQWRQTLQQPPV
jgi:hypothetical protein